MKITVKQLDKNSFPDALAVRYTVFCDEQGYARDYERDEHDVFTDSNFDSPDSDFCGAVDTRADHPLCGTVHFAAYDEDKAVPIGAGRIIFGSGEFPCKIGRIAVLKEYRRFGAGKLIMNTLIAFAKQKGAKEIVLDSQVSAVGFYQKFGFVPFGEEHPDMHIMHQFMRLTLQ